jgi:hypothetical protein
MNNCAKINTKYAALLIAKDIFLQGYAEFKKAKTAEAKKNLLDLMKKIRTTEAELRKDGDRNYVGLREEIAKQYGAEFVSGFQNNMAYAEFADGSRIPVNFDGEKIADSIFRKGVLESINDGIAIVRVERSAYCIKSDGTRIKIQDARVPTGSVFQEGFLRVEKNVNGVNLSGFMDRNGKMFPKNENDWYSFADSYSCGFARVMSAGAYRFIDKTGNIFNKAGHSRFEEVENFSENIAAVRLPGETDWRYMNTDGKIISGKYEFDQACPFKNGMGLVKTLVNPDNNWICYNFLTPDGRLIPESVEQGFMDLPTDFSEGYATWSTEDTCGFVDKAGQCYPELFTTNPVFIEINPFSDGRSFVRFPDGRSGYIDKNFKMVFECEKGAQFSDGVAQITKNGLSYLIDINGKKVF